MWAGLIYSTQVMVCEITGTTKDRIMSCSDNKLSISQELFITYEWIIISVNIWWNLNARRPDVLLMTI